MRGTVGELGELGLLERLAEVFARPDPRVLVGIGDDAAILRLEGHLVATVDALEAGIDWLDGSTPRDAIGHRAAAVNLSDLAAMGARPRALLVALELPADLGVDALLHSARALADLAGRHGAAVVGGDLGIGRVERWTVTALGTLDGPGLRRDAARPGDRVRLIGQVGLAALGLARRRGELEGPDALFVEAVQAHLRPRPRVQAGLLLSGTGARVAAIDISDGLLLDARRLARSSGVRLELELPRAKWLGDELLAACERAGVNWRRACAAGGDDYALLVCAAPELGLEGRSIGEVVAGRGVALVVDGVRLDGPGGFVHGGGQR